MKLSRRYEFQAAHRLPNVSAGHKCGRVHGHTYHVEIVIRGEPDEVTGWICDFGDVDKAWSPIFRTLDHRYLNEIPGLENPTCERIATWIAVELQGVFGDGLAAVTVGENGRGGVTWERESEAA